jgi:tetratricopeptide (TPR) repeat protein
MHLIREAFDAALTDLKTAEKLAPEDPVTQHYLGRTYRLSGKLETAVKHYSRAIELDATRVQSYFARATAYEQMDEVALALRDATKALELDPKYAECARFRGWLYLRLGKHELALADLDLAVPALKSARAYLSRAWARLHTGDLEGARADANVVVALDPEAAWPWVVLYRVRTARGDLAEAKEAVRTCLSRKNVDEHGAGAHLALKYLLGDATLGELKKHPAWSECEIAIRGWRRGQRAVSP